MHPISTNKLTMPARWFTRKSDCSLELTPRSTRRPRLPTSENWTTLEKDIYTGLTLEGKK
jgi:hypothetical protein